MNTRYIRNRLYLTDSEHEIINNCPILLAGSGIGSVIAECILRLGFENITIIDGDHVELSNLNRQNYTEKDIETYKVDAITKRLNSINPNANIVTHNCYLTTENIENYVKNHHIAINALDFTTKAPLEFDKICQKNGIHVLHPYNLGWAGLVTIITPNGLSLEEINDEETEFNELKMVEYAISTLKSKGTSTSWLDEIVEKYINETEKMSPPQLSVGSWLVASMCTHILVNIATKKEVKQFPEFYYSTIMGS